MPSTLVIYNPVAGRGRVRDVWLFLEKALTEAGVEFDVAPTNAPLDAMNLARDAAQKYERVVAVGGDGTVHEVVNGLLRASNEGETIAMGVVPLGNGDDFAKVIPPETAIGKKPFDWKMAVAKIAHGQTKLFDVGRMEGDHLRPELGTGAHYFMNGIDVGFGAEASLNFTTIPKFLVGMTAYMATIFKTMVNYPTVRLRIQLDDEPPFDQATTMTAVTNGRCFANGFWVTPDAQPDDGLFDVMIADAVSRIQILGLIPKIMKGTHTHEPIIKMRRAKRVIFDSIEPFVVESDGEVHYLDTRHLQVDILPRRLKVIV